MTQPATQLTISEHELILLFAKLLKVDICRRWTEQAPNTALNELMLAGQDRYIKTLKGFCAYTEALSSIAFQASPELNEPSWQNTWLPAFDAIALYGYIADQKPATYLEVGSGNSTLFARRAIRDQQLKTHIISIDPQPRASIDSVCDTIIRKRLQDMDWRPLVLELKAGDVVFFDGSHHAFQNSDVTVFFTEILPAIPAGVTVGIHDIFLPYEYPEEFLGRFYGEQYQLACWLLAGQGHSVEIAMPAYWISVSPAAQICREAVSPVFTSLPFGVNQQGSAFWIKKI